MNKNKIMYLDNKGELHINHIDNIAEYYTIIPTIKKILKLLGLVDGRQNKELFLNGWIAEKKYL